jgi:hypothetical protein
MTGCSLCAQGPSQSSPSMKAQTGFYIRVCHKIAKVPRATPINGPQSLRCAPLPHRSRRAGDVPVQLFSSSCRRTKRMRRDRATRHHLSSHFSIISFGPVNRRPSSANALIEQFRPRRLTTLRILTRRKSLRVALLGSSSTHNTAERFRGGRVFHRLSLRVLVKRNTRERTISPSSLHQMGVFMRLSAMF